MIADLHSRLDLERAVFEGGSFSERRLSHLRDAYADERAYETALAQGDPVIYTVSALTPDEGEGALHCAVGRIAPGRIGREYHLTKGHFHAWRAASEYYIGLRGQGAMLLEDEEGHSRLVPLSANSAVYVPGYTAHRTINTGGEALVYLGIYPAAAGHDYGAIAERNFRKVVVDVDGEPTLLDRHVFLASLASDSEQLSSKGGSAQ